MEGRILSKARTLVAAGAHDAGPRSRRMAHRMQVALARRSRGGRRMRYTATHRVCRGAVRCGIAAASYSKPRGSPCRRSSVPIAARLSKAPGTGNQAGGQMIHKLADDHFPRPELAIAALKSALDDQREKQRDRSIAHGGGDTYTCHAGLARSCPLLGAPTRATARRADRPVAPAGTLTDHRHLRAQAEACAQAQGPGCPSPVRASSLRRATRR